MTKKYELIKSDKPGLFRIRSLKSFGYVTKGDIGGYIESDYNLSHEGDCWIYDNAYVYGNARICGYVDVHEGTHASGSGYVSTPR